MKEPEIPCLKWYLTLLIDFDYTLLINITHSTEIYDMESIVTALFQPYPYPINKNSDVFFREPIIGKLQSSLSVVARSLDSIT